MDIKLNLEKGLCLFLVLYIQGFFAQIKTDTLQTWIDNFATYTNFQLSPDSRWILANKSFDTNTDSLFIFDVKHPGIVKEKWVKMNIKCGFIGSKALVVQGQGTAEYIRLGNFSKVQYPSIKKLAILSKLKRYIILDNDNVLKLYDENSREIIKINDVEDYVTNSIETVIAITKKGKYRKLIDFFSGNLQPFYSTEYKIAETLQFQSGRYIAFTETDEVTGSLRCVLWDKKTGGIKLPLGNIFVKSDFLKITEIKDGKAFLINSEKRIYPNNDGIAETWYGNEKYLRYKKKWNTESEYWLWLPEQDQAEKLKNKAFTDYVAINSENHFLAFDNAEQFDYRFSMPVFPLYLFDKTTGGSEKICDGTRNVVISQSGRYILMQDELVKKWKLFDTTMGKSYTIGNPEMQNPLYSDDEHWLLFESNNGLQIFNLQREKFEPSLLKGKEVFFVNSNYTKVFEKYNTSFTINSDKISSGLLIKTYDADKDTTGYYRWVGKGLMQVIDDTTNNVKDFKYSINNVPVAVTVEESYNQRSQIFHYQVQKKQKVCISTDFVNEEAQIRRVIISYRNSKGTTLKGVLYYPVGFEKGKQYPMVVSIYQEQSRLANKYPYPSYGGDGFNIRLLMEKGYFVFLPDIIADERGSGIAALDCINSALDRIAQFDFIDMKNIGLIGHSFGSYETNFIATQSNRIKAYISGSGVSDLTARYFMYNSSYGINEYSRIENGQYDMKIPFSKSKDKYYTNNPIYFTEKVKAPILLWSGTEDGNVPYDQSMSFYTALQRNRKDVILLLYKDQGHVLTKGSEAAKDLANKTLQWWDYFLKSKTVVWIDLQIKKDA